MFYSLTEYVLNSQMEIVEELGSGMRKSFKYTPRFYAFSIGLVQLVAVDVCLDGSLHGIAGIVAIRLLDVLAHQCGVEKLIEITKCFGKMLVAVSTQQGGVPGFHRGVAALLHRYAWQRCADGLCRALLESAPGR